MGVPGLESELVASLGVNLELRFNGNFTATSGKTCEFACVFTYLSTFLTLEYESMHRRDKKIHSYGLVGSRGERKRGGRSVCWVLVEAGTGE